MAGSGAMFRLLVLCCLGLEMMTASALLTRPAARAMLRSSGCGLTPRRRAGSPSVKGSSVKMIWHAHPRLEPGANKGINPAVCYWVERGTTQALGQDDCVPYRPHVAPDQAIVQVAPDGSEIYIYAQGNTPTG